MQFLAMCAVQECLQWRVSKGVRGGGSSVGSASSLEHGLWNIATVQLAVCLRTGSSGAVGGVASRCVFSGHVAVL